MSPAAEAHEPVEASAEALDSKARSLLTYSPDEIFQKSWQVRGSEFDFRGERFHSLRSCPLSTFRPFPTSTSTSFLFQKNFLRQKKTDLPARRRRRPPGPRQAHRHHRLAAGATAEGQREAPERPRPRERRRGVPDEGSVRRGGEALSGFLFSCCGGLHHPVHGRR